MYSLIFTSIILALCLPYSAVGLNTTDKYPRIEKQTSRQARLLSFNTEENGDINVELSFNVPFLRVPVKKSMDHAKTAVANINIGSVVLAGAMVFIVSALIPAVNLLFSKKTPNFRDLDRDDAPLWRLAQFVEDTLKKNDIDLGACMQKYVCQTVRKATRNTANRQASTSDKIVDALVTNEWIEKIVGSTAMFDMVKRGMNGENCSNQCNIDKDSVELMMKRFISDLSYE